jgi:hypothetical protein
LRDDLSTRDVSGPFNQIASPEVLMNSGSAQKPGAIGPGYKPGVQAWYNQFLVVDPADGNHLYAGLEDVYETTDAGKSWITAAPYWNLTLKCFDISAPDFGGCPNTTHSDQHAATVANGTLWVGNDGGVFSRPTGVHTNGGSWTDHNRYLGTLQYYYADSGKDPTSGATVFCVASDFYAGGEVLWKSMSGFRTGEDDWSAQFDTGAGRSISALAVAGGNGYAAWCGPCWPGYVSETGFGRGVITNLGTGAWRQLDLSAVPTAAMRSRTATSPASRSIPPTVGTHTCPSRATPATGWSVPTIPAWDTYSRPPTEERAGTTSAATSSTRPPTTWRSSAATSWSPTTSASSPPGYRAVRGSASAWASRTRSPRTSTRRRMGAC